MNARTYLSRAYCLDGRINAKLEQLVRLRSLAEKVNGTIRKAKVSPAGYIGSPLEETVARILETEKAVNDEIDRLIDVKEEIAGMIARMDNEDERLLLELRYLCFNKWQEIASKMHIGIASAYRMHLDALNSFDAILGRQANG